MGYMMKIDINKKQDVICEAGNVYTHDRRIGTFYCYKSEEDLHFINLVDGNSYDFTFLERQEFTLKGKILNIETHL